MIVLLGITGSGKSLQSRLLADKYGYTWISTGEVLRTLLSGANHQQMLEGKLVDDQEMIRIMGKLLQTLDPKQQMVLDGFPRTLAQANWLIERAKAGAFDLTAVFYFNVSQAKVRDRLVARGRADDTDEAINRRFEQYSAIIEPIIERFETEGFKVIRIEADADPKTIHEAIVKTINPPTVII